MNPIRRTPVSDERLRTALTRSPNPNLIAMDLARISATLERTGQRPASTLRLLPLAATLAVAALIVLVGLALTVGSQPHRYRAITPARTGLVAYDVDGDIWVANPDGSGRRPLTTGPGFEWQPLWSPDGTKLAYWSSDSSDPGDPAVRRRLMVVDIGAQGSGGAVAVASVSSEAGWRASWAPDSRRLAYSDKIGGARTILVVDSDSPNPVRIGPAGMDSWDPAWSPDGERIAFPAGNSIQDRGLFVMAPDGTGVDRITHIRSLQDAFNLPVWSPRGDRIAFTAGTEGPNPFQQDVWVVGLDGGPEVDISNDPANESTVSWSPDGAFLSFFRRVRPDQQGEVIAHIIVMNADGTRSTELPQDVGGISADWSPDGTQLLAYPLLLGTPAQVIAINPATRGSVVIADGTPTGSGSWQRLAP